MIVKLNHAKEFLEGNNKVRFTIMFKGRENTHKELGDRLAVRIQNELKEHGEIETRPFLMGTRLLMSFTQKKTVKKTE